MAECTLLKQFSNCLLKTLNPWALNREKEQAS